MIKTLGIYLLLLLFFTIATLTPYAQSLTFDHLTIDQGLSHNTIYTILEDRDGFLWFGSRDGLNRYDGYEFKVYKEEINQGQGLVSNAIQCLFEDQAGNIWIGLRRGGLSILDRNSQEFKENPLEKLSEVDWQKFAIQSIFQDSQKNIWLATLGNGVIRLSPDLQTYQHFHSQSQNKNHRLSNNLAFAFAEDAEKNIWIGVSGSTLNCYETQSDKIIHIWDKPAEGVILGSYSKSLLFHKDKLWIGTEGNHLYCYNPKQKTFKKREIGNGLVKDIAIDHKQRIWVSTDGTGLFYSDDLGESFQHSYFSGTLNNSLNTNALYDIYVDKRNNIWVGSFNGGINVYKPNKSEFLTFLKSASNTNAPNLQSVLCFEEDEQGNIWIGTDGRGLLKFNLESQTFITYQYDPNNDNTLSTNVITSLFIDSEGFVWAGTFNQGLNKFDPASGQVTRFQPDPNNPHSLSNNNVWDIVEDKEQNLWVGVLGGGLNKLDKESLQFKRVIPQNGRLGELNDIVALLICKKNKLWIGTEFDGLYQLNLKDGQLKQWKRINEDEHSLPSNSIRCLYEDSQGNIWVGTEGGGLAQLQKNQKEFQSFSTQEGLSSNVVNAIEEDQNGILWMSTNMGLSAFNLENQTFTNFNKNDGLQSNQFNPKASLKSKSGRLFFGGIHGFNIFTSENLLNNPNPPRAVFTDFKLFNQSITSSKFEGRKILSEYINLNPTIQLNYSENVFTIEFAALEYTNPSKNKIAYRLLGFENDWNYVDANQRSATFTNLDAGTYTFELKGANNQGVWSEDIKTLRIEISPPFWKTWWFRILLTLLVFGLIYLYVRYQNQRKEEKYREKLLLAEQKMLQQDKQRLEDEIQQKNAELSASLLDFAHKNTTLQNLKKELKSLKEEIGEEPTTQKKIKKLMREIDAEIKTENYWDQFQLHFDKVHQEFSQQILAMHPDLSASELRLCCFIRINLSNADIASIQNISTRGVEKSRYRLKKKLQLSKEDDLNHYILHF